MTAWSPQSIETSIAVAVGPGGDRGGDRDRGLEVLRVGVGAGGRRRATTVRWLRRVSWYCRTWSLLAFAEDRQCTWRRSSPGTYSRRAWKARSLIETSSLGVPSWSRIAPAASDSTGTIRGSTSSSAAGDHRSVHRSSASGSVTARGHRADRRSPRDAGRRARSAPRRPGYGAASAAGPGVMRRRPGRATSGLGTGAGPSTPRESSTSALSPAVVRGGDTARRTVARRGSRASTTATAPQHQRRPPRGPGRPASRRRCPAA